MRAFFIGGMVDNSELDMEDGRDPPVHYPANTGSGQPRYRLHRAARRGARVIYAIYAAPEMASEEVERIAIERNYEGRFGAAH